MVLLYNYLDLGTVWVFCIFMQNNFEILFNLVHVTSSQVIVYLISYKLGKALRHSSPAHSVIVCKKFVVNVELLYSVYLKALTL